MFDLEDSSTARAEGFVSACDSSNIGPINEEDLPLGYPTGECKFKLGQTVQVDNGRYKGILRYYGFVEFQKGVWAGVELDGSNGKNNGTVGGVQYFECKHNHGLFINAIRISEIPASIDGKDGHGSIAEYLSHDLSLDLSNLRDDDILSPSAEGGTDSEVLSPIKGNNSENTQSLNTPIDVLDLLDDDIRKENVEEPGISLGDLGSIRERMLKPIEYLDIQTSFVFDECDSHFENRMSSPSRFNSLFKRKSSENDEGKDRIDEIQRLQKLLIEKEMFITSLQRGLVGGSSLEMSEESVRRDLKKKDEMISTLQNEIEHLHNNSIQKVKDNEMEKSYKELQRDYENLKNSAHMESSGLKISLEKCTARVNELEKELYEKKAFIEECSRIDDFLKIFIKYIKHLFDIISSIMKNECDLDAINANDQQIEVLDNILNKAKSLVGSENSEMIEFLDSVNPRLLTGHLRDFMNRCREHRVSEEETSLDGCFLSRCDGKSEDTNIVIANLKNELLKNVLPYIQVQIDKYVCPTKGTRNGSFVGSDELTALDSKYNHIDRLLKSKVIELMDIVGM